MAKYEVVITRTKIEIASIEVTADSREAAEMKVKSRVEPQFDMSEALGVTRTKEKAAKRYFESHLSESADHSTEFEYEADEI